MVREVFLDCGRVARELIASPEVGRRWEDESALTHLSVGAVAAHLARGVLTVPFYMAVELPDPLPAPVNASAYFVAALTPNLDDELNRSIRERSNEGARDGQAGVLQRLDDALGTLHTSLAEAPPDACVAVFGGMVMRLDDYLVTRILEQVVHLDDLAVSIGVDTPPVDTRAVDLVTHCFVDVARLRHGDLGVIRALARRERAPAGVFPVF